MIYIPKQLYIQVVVKFLRKSGVLKGSWVKDDDMGLVALEISLLARLSHPNIVMVRESVWSSKTYPDHFEGIESQYKS